jgi:3-oxoacyl-[acyl-carrier protein] reductase
MPSALITGASRGIGRAIALRLAPAYDVFILARSAGALESLGAEIAAKGGRATAVEADLRDPTAVAAALAGVECDVLVNNAGVVPKGPFLEMTTEQWNETIAVNLSAIFHVSRAVVPGMIARGSGHVVNIASIAGRGPLPGGACYGATKHAVIGLSESLMLELRDHGVRVSCVLPGSVATDVFPPEVDSSWMLKPEDVAEAVADVLATRAQSLMFTVEVRAARPKKKS